MAETPTLFREINNPVSFILVPKVSSEKRRYVPMGFLDNNTISTDLNFIIPEATMYHFAILTSNIHMAWMRAVCGRMKSDYRYSANIVYNNFPKKYYPSSHIIDTRFDLREGDMFPRDT